MNSKDKVALQTVLVAVIILVAIIYALFIRPNYYNFNGGNISFEPVSVETFSTEDSNDIYVYNEYLYLSNKNGLKKVSSNGESLWNKAFYIENPLFQKDRGYMSVLDLGGKIAYLFGEDGFVSQINTEYPIIIGDTSSQGAMALVQEKDGSHIIQLYNRKGTLVAERGTSYEADGYPIGIDLSSTGEKMVTSYLTLKEGIATSNITFFSFGASGEVNPENILGGFILDGSMTPEVKFLDDTSAVAISDNRIDFYSVKGTPRLVKEIKLEKEIAQVQYTDENIVISYVAEQKSPEERPHSGIEVYDFGGDLVDHYTTTDEVRHLIREGKDYYLLMTHSIEYHHAKKLVWKSPYEKDAKSIMKLGKDQYLIVLQQGYEIVKVKDI